MHQKIDRFLKASWNVIFSNKSEKMSPGVSPRGRPDGKCRSSAEGLGGVAERRAPSQELCPRSPTERDRKTLKVGLARRPRMGGGAPRPSGGRRAGRAGRKNYFQNPSNICQKRNKHVYKLVKMHNGNRIIKCRRG